MSDDWRYNPESGKLSLNKEAILRSKVRIEARQFHMSRLHRGTWGEKQTVDVNANFNLMSEAELLEKAKELLGMVEFLNAPPPQPPPLVYRGEETEDDPPGGIG